MATVDDYPPEWPEVNLATKIEAGFRCVRCGHPNGARIQVPRHRRRMSEDEIHRALKQNQPHLLPHLTETIKRWQGSGVLDLGKLRELLEEREAFDQESSDG